MNATLTDIVLLSLRVAFFALLWAVPLAYFLACLLYFKRFRGRRLLSAVVMLPLVMPPVVTGLVLLHLFGPHAFLGRVMAQFGLSFAFNAAGASLAAGLVSLPLIVRPVLLSFERVDVDLDEALRVSGLSRWRRFRMLYWPFSLPGVIAGSVLGFAKSLGEFGATITFVANIPGETQTFSLAINAALQRIDGANAVWVLATMSVVISILAILISDHLLEWLQGRLLGGGGRRHARG